MPIVREVAHHDEHLADELGVERRRDLVEQHDVRLHHQRARDRDPLLLPAGELVRVLPRLLLEPDAPSSSCARASASRLLHLADAPRGERQVVDHAEMREEIELLEHDPDALADLRDVRRPCRVISSPSR